MEDLQAYRPQEDGSWEAQNAMKACLSEPQGSLPEADPLADEAA